MPAKLLCRSTACVFLMMLSLSASAKIYTWVDENGKVQYSDRKPASDKNVKQMEIGPVNSSNAVDIPQPSHDDYVQKTELEQQAQAKLQSDAKSWALKECVWRWQWNDPVKNEDGEVVSHRRKRVNVCKSPIPSKYRQFLSDFKYDKAFYYGQ